MTILTDFVDGKQPKEDLGLRVICVENTLDFSVTNVGSGNVVQALKIPANVRVIDCGFEVIVAEGSAASCDLGDSADPNGFDDAIDLNASAILATTRGTDAYALGRRYTAADTIDLEVHGDLTVGKVRVWAVYLKEESS